MKVLLVSINAKYIHTNNAVRLLKANSSFNPEILEYTIKDDIDEIIQVINSKQVDVIGFSVYIWNVGLIIKIIEKLDLEGSKLILGGPEVSYEPSHFLINDKVDFIIKGEGEVVFNELLTHLDNKTSYEYLDNLSFKKNNKLYHNPIVEIDNLSIVKPPYYFEEDKNHIPNKIAYIESSRGCPYKCSYCLSSLEKRVRFFDIEGVKNAIMYLMENGARTIKFLDRTFNANRQTMEILEYIIIVNNKRTVFQFEITGDVLDPEIIEYLNKNAPKGLFRFEIGIQSINYETNYLVDRFQNTEKLFDNIKAIQEGGIIDLHLDLIAGLPSEDLHSFINTFDEVFRLGCKELQLGFLKMLRGTKIRLEAAKYNYVFHEEAPYEIIRNNVLSESDIKEIHMVEHMLEIHHNKGYFGDNMLDIILKYKSPYYFFKEMGLLYQKMNYSLNGYQLDEIYQRVFDYLKNDYQIFTLKQDYLMRSKVKPKIFFKNDITKAERNAICKDASDKHDIPLHKVFKHSVLIRHNDYYFMTYYENNTCKTFKI